ncbi:hypothetical protein GobsU_17675 [Candidatus Moduliflexus flocculans]|uniref:Membrane-bound metal-dependent hydrolase n=1 Tax=Candidatus Moduliflexus flocculans TaxID=1499966 RepID=A0A0S6VPY6_9BACT|nr:hypothetical protein GobsU_17675 [Candidatus Moduliflexus flocculans]
MAAFRTHVTAGLLVGYAAGAFAELSRWTVEPFTPFAMFAAGFIGAFLPDMDSDSGKPFAIIFDLLAIVGGSIVYLHILSQPPLPWYLWIAFPPLGALAIRYGVGWIFRKYTAHRGIFHSIPAALIVTFAAPFALRSFRLDDRDLFAIAVSIGLGYLSHLILDEVYAFVNFEGLKIKPKKSFGTALSFAEDSKAVTVIAYVILAALAIIQWDWLLAVWQDARLMLK